MKNPKIKEKFNNLKKKFQQFKVKEIYNPRFNKQIIQEL
jgi:hypothetical protein